MIHEVYEEGAAARDGRLWAGDQILEVFTDTAPPTGGGAHLPVITSLTGCIRAITLVGECSYCSQ